VISRAANDSFMSNLPFRGEGGKVWNRRVSPIASVPMKVRSLHRQQPLSLHRRNRSICPFAAVRRHHRERPSWVQAV
jgi:hypothetical protein